jgi:hypothetical protein
MNYLNRLIQVQTLASQRFAGGHRYVGPATEQHLLFFPRTILFCPDPIRVLPGTAIEREREGCSRSIAVHLAGAGDAVALRGGGGALGRARRTRVVVAGGPAGGGRGGMEVFVAARRRRRRSSSSPAVAVSDLSSNSSSSPSDGAGGGM